MLIAVLVILAGIVAVAVGRGGELSQEQPDFAPMDLGPVSATDVILLRPPTALWGYSMQVTDEALERIAAAMRDRDVRIVALEQRIADLTSEDDYALASSSARHARRPTLSLPTTVEPPGLSDPPLVGEPPAQNGAATAEPATEDDPVAEELSGTESDTDELLAAAEPTTDEFAAVGESEAPGEAGAVGKPETAGETDTPDEVSVADEPAGEAESHAAHGTDTDPRA